MPTGSRAASQPCAWAAGCRRRGRNFGSDLPHPACADAHQKRVRRNVRERFPIPSERKPLYTSRGRTIVRSHIITNREVDVMADTSLSRRQLLAGASANNALGLIGTAAPAKAPMLHTTAPALH